MSYRGLGVCLNPLDTDCVNAELSAQARSMSTRPGADPDPSHYFGNPGYDAWSRLNNLPKTRGLSPEYYAQLKAAGQLEAGDYINSPKPDPAGCAYSYTTNPSNPAALMCCTADNYCTPFSPAQIAAVSNPAPAPAPQPPPTTRAGSGPTTNYVPSSGQAEQLLTRSTNVGGFSIPIWAFLAAGAAGLLLMRGR